VDWNDENTAFKKNKECSELKNTSGAYQKFYSPKENTCVVYFIK